MVLEEAAADVLEEAAAEALEVEAGAMVLKVEAQAAVHEVETAAAMLESKAEAPSEEAGFAVISLMVVALDFGADSCTLARWARTETDGRSARGVAKEGRSSRAAEAGWSERSFVTCCHPQC